MAIRADFIMRSRLVSQDPIGLKTVELSLSTCSLAIEAVARHMP